MASRVTHLGRFPLQLRALTSSARVADKSHHNASIQTLTTPGISHQPLLLPVCYNGLALSESPYNCNLLTGNQRVPSSHLILSRRVSARTTLQNDDLNLPTISSDLDRACDAKKKTTEQAALEKSSANRWLPPALASVWVSTTTNDQIQGAIIPFSQLNFLQIIVFPYTYAAMYYLELMHQFLPWWQAIILTTATARLVFFPCVVKQNVIGIKTANIAPETQQIQVKLNAAMVSGDAYTQALERSKLQLLWKKHGLSMKDRLLPVLIQAPMFASIFFLLRTLTGVPVEGLATGGAFWFTDLTVPDPYKILPLVTSTSMLMLFEFGLEGAVNPRTSMGPIGRYILRAMPIGLFFFIQNFPAATLLFWSTSNVFTLGYALLLKNKWVKKKLNIPVRIEHDMSQLPMASQSFSGQVKTAIEKGKVKRTSMDVRRLDDIAFKKHGVGPLRKTYKEPPKKE